MVFQNRALIRTVTRNGELPSKFTVNIHEHMATASGNAKVSSKGAHQEALNETIGAPMWRQQQSPSLTFSRAMHPTKVAEARGYNYEVLSRTPSSLGMHKELIARQRTPKYDIAATLVFLITIFVLVGFFLVAFFPNLRRGIVDQLHVLKRLFSQQDNRMRSALRRSRSTAENAFLKSFEVGEKLGEGAFGVVHVVFSRSEGKKFAAKMIDVMGSDLELIKEEVAILKRVQHPSLTACCLHEYHDQCFFYLVMPIYGGGDLSGAVSDYIDTQGLLPEALFARLFEQMARGVAFVQSKQVVHRDIKPENFLLASSKLDDKRNVVVVADFGMSTVLDAGVFLDEICGTPIFMSPELFTGKYEFKVDVFALGLSAFVLLTGAFAFNTEKEIRTWEKSSDPPPIPPSISPDTQEIFVKTLERDASQRVSAKDLETLATKLRSHSFDHRSIAKRQSMRPMTNERGRRTLGIGGGDLQEKQAARRHRMLCELIKGHMGAGKVANYAGGANYSAEVLAAKKFEIKKGRRNRIVSRFEFWSREDCLKKHVSGIEDHEMNPLAQVAETLSSDVQLLDDVLARYHVDRDMWGKGKAKSLTDLAKECRGGICFLTEDEKMLERVVEIVALVVRNGDGCILHQFPLMPKAALGKASQRRITAMQSTFTEPRLPARKMEAWETVHEATDRVLEKIGMSSEVVDLCFDAPMQVVKELSASYPGLTTVYKKHMVEAFILENDCSSDQLAQWGIPGSKKFVAKTDEGASNFGWLSPSEAEDLGTLDEGEEGLGMRYVEVLPVKTKVISGDRIKEMLRNTNANVDNMSDDALEELAEQIRTGEVELVEEEQPDGSRSLKRKVTVTMLRLVHEEGSILLEVSRSKDGGTSWKNTNWLPAAKQHTFESPYYVARRMLTSMFMVAEGHWRMDKDEGGCIIEEHESDTLPGLPTIYTKNVVAARLC